jgi:hypothetical protein
VANSDLELQRFHLGQAMRGLVGPAMRALASSSRRPEGSPPFRRDIVWSLGSLVEAGGFLCLGVDLGYLPRTDTTEALRRLFARPPAAELAEEERALVVGNAWADHLALGDAKEALAVRAFADLPEETAALLPAFQSAWSFAARLATSAAANRFLRRLLLAGEEAWRAEMDDHGIGSAAVLAGPGDEQAWSRLAAGHPLDGLLDALRHLEIVSEWAASAQAAARRHGRRPGLRLGDEESAATAARILVRSVGRLLRWRLDLANQSVNRRLGRAIDDADGILGELLAAVGGNATDVWPEGFRAAATQALADWEEISGEATRIHPGPGGGSPAQAAAEPREAPQATFLSPAAR